MDAERFATERYEDQRRWYSDKATHYKQIAHRVSVAIVVMSVLLPVTTSSLPCDWSYRWISVVLSLGIGLATGLAGIFRWRELWITYRATEESLKREHSFYVARVKEYGETEQPVQLFVERMEEILSGEHLKWVAAEKALAKSVIPSQNREKRNEETGVL